MIPATAKSDTQPSYGEILCLSLDDILPSKDDQRKLLEKYCVLFARVICEHIPFFQKFADCVPSHIKQMSQKSEVVSIPHQNTTQKWNHPYVLCKLNMTALHLSCTKFHMYLTFGCILYRIGGE